MQTCNIRQAQAKDIDVLFEFIQALAEYQGILHRLTIDKSSLQELLFGSNASSEAFIAEKESQTVGFAFISTMNINRLYQRTPAVYLDELFILPEYRKQGFGKQLFDFIANIAQEKGYNRVEWWVMDDNDKAVPFYENLGAKAFPEYKVWRLNF